MSINSARSAVQSLTVAATGTGSVYFKVEGTPYVGLQVVKEATATTNEQLNIYFSNFDNRDFAGSVLGTDDGPITGSVNAPGYVWAGPDTSFSGTLFTGSGGPASQMYNLTNVAARHMRVETASKTGGVFRFAISRKGR